MINNFLFDLYFKSPLKLRRFVLGRIIKTEGQMYSGTLRKIFERQYNIKIGYGSYGGCFNAKNIPSGVVFGNYCSIAQNIKIFRANHPVVNFTTHPLLYNPVAGYVKEDKLLRPVLEICHDVWIGEGAIILPNVKIIGNGAVIGAGSIVTKDVEPYTIVAGNPAKRIGQRFHNNVIDEIEKTRWWEYKKDELITNISKLSEIVKKNNF